jgi:hypothetical protein
MGALYMPSHYTAVFDLVKEFDSDNKLIFHEKEQNFFLSGVDIAKPESDINSKHPLIDYQLEKAVPKWASSLPKGAARSAAAKANIAANILRYNLLHKNIFGTYEYGVPPVPRSWDEIDMTAYEFLQKHNLLALEGIVLIIMSFSGYGESHDIHAFYLLWWMHPTWTTVYFC